MPHHIGLDSTTAKVAIICGAPERIPVLSNFFDHSKKLTDKRGFLIHEGYHNGECLLFVAAGIGGPTTAIAVEELIEIGIEVIIRVGTCGGLFPTVMPGDIVISSGAVRDEGTSRQYMDLSYPAIPNPYLLSYFINAAEASGHRHHVGITHCKDAYYMEKPQYQVDASQTKNRWLALRNANVLATEMEAAVLFTLGGLRRVITGALFINVGKEKEPEKEFRALETIVHMIKSSMDDMISLTTKGKRMQRQMDDVSFLDN